MRPVRDEDGTWSVVDEFGETVVLSLNTEEDAWEWIDGYDSN